jgi:predicted small secreted protein
MRKSVIIAATIFAGLAVTACNTVEGAGKDVSSAGKAVSSTAKDAKN